MRRVTAYGPACVGNLAAGFDVLGAALAPIPEAAGVGSASSLWGDTVEIIEIIEAIEIVEEGYVGEVRAAEVAAGARLRLVCGGPFARMLPADPAENVAVRACLAFERRLGGRLPALEVRLHKGLPVGSGLGSSSATAVAVLRALDALLGGPLPERELLAAAGEAEEHASGCRHLDNVAPALLGGLRLVEPGGGARALPFPDDLRFVVASPELTLMTRAARAVLPATVPFELAVAHGQNLAALVHALYAGDRGLLRVCLRDLLAEPHRAGLVPGFRAVQAAAMGAGAWGCSFSGAGPAVFAVAEAAGAAALGAAMRQAWAAAGVASEVRVCALDRQGARVLEARGCG